MTDALNETVILNNGVEMPTIGYGTWDLRGTDCERCVGDAIRSGFRLIDTARMYGNEKSVGNAVRECGVPRDELFITAKISIPDNSYEKAKKAIDALLNDLQTDYVDLLLVHEPYEMSMEMYVAMEEAYNSEKTRAVGISNFNTELFRRFTKSCGVVPAVNQVESHVFFQQSALKRVLMEKGVLMQAWSPLASGKNNIFENPVLNEIGGKYQKTAAQVALRFLVQNGIAPVTKTVRKERMAENLDIFDFRLDDEEMGAIIGLDRGKSLFGWY